ncbi:uncharacterized protein LOC130747804 [Lotus japonicus]|uniref:uncharacterized protein LOC130747804 n=1 Tax=Lotus japonicus TaxID=34305 RepID=UPI00258E9948|nr:uncharacterized protein LOC130747804 [Lotus japonicus]
MAVASIAPFSITGGSHLKQPELCSAKRNLSLQRKSSLVITTRKRRSAISAEYRDNSGGGGGDFIAGFLLGGAIFGTVAYIFSPQIRRSVLNENEYGFRKAKRPVYYDEGLERTRESLNKKIGKLNSAIDDVSSRLRGAKNVPASHVGSDPEVESTL